ncbi:hypothetical protein [Bartonella tamiae]|uniref:Uncharacterized protein n=1 Tax=Bartonella tamiae Th239 TaxID=1094558 RepID=J1K3G0_9HYPH|nr:hypothetical protein [Bartonella tamiae]EJF91665.1 hypothetical protein ME5_00044 [Bartonella tamiae Th239]
MVEVIKKKARSKAEKLRLKRNKGRPAMADADREKNGRLSRRKASINRRKLETEKEIKSVVIAARERMGIPMSYLNTAESGNALGRIMIMFPDIIKRYHYLAGLRFGEAFARYYYLVGIPFPSARSADLLNVHGRNDYENIDAVRKATDHVMILEQIIGMVDISGLPIKKVMKQVCIEDVDQNMNYSHMVQFLRKGLDALVDYYQIDRN